MTDSPIKINVPPEAAAALQASGPALQASGPKPLNRYISLMCKKTVLRSVGKLAHRYVGLQKQLGYYSPSRLSVLLGTVSYTAMYIGSYEGPNA